MPCQGDGQDRAAAAGLARPGSLQLHFLCPHASQAVQTQASRPRRTPEEQPWERLAVHGVWLQEVALVCFPAALGASFPLCVCFAFQQLPAVEGRLPRGPRPWSPGHFQTRRSILEQQLNPRPWLPESTLGHLAIESN